jgi:hypothetical protein
MIGDGTSVAKWGRLRMGFLDTIGQRPPESRPKSSRPSVAPNLMRDDAARAAKTVQPLKSRQSNRVHPAAIFSVALIVAAVGGGAWLGVRNAAVFSPGTEPAAGASSEDAATPVEQSAQKRRLEGPQAPVRRGTGVKPLANGANPRADTPIEVSVSDLAPVNELANVTETEGPPIPAASDPIAPASIVALPEDDNVYSSEGGGVVAPTLTSLGFVRRLVSGLRVRTSTIELVVSKTGTVERAKIFSTPAHWEDALLLSRAKMFQFVPAYRNGYPVRYRFVLDVDTSP